MSTINFAKPSIADAHSTLFVPNLNQAINSLGFLLDPAFVTDVSGQLTGTKRFREAVGAFERWNGTTWANLAVNGLLWSSPNAALGSSVFTSLGANITTLSLGSSIAGVSGAIAFQASGVHKGTAFVDSDKVTLAGVTGVGFRVLVNGVIDALNINTSGVIFCGGATTSPLSRFKQVLGDGLTAAALLLSSSEQYAMALNRGGNAFGRYYLGVEAASASPSLRFSNSAGTGRMWLSDAGYLGINNSAPAARLDVIESVAGQVVRFAGPVTSLNQINLVSGTTVIANIKWDSTTGSTGVANSLALNSAGGGIAFQNGGATVMQLDGSGNLGVGVVPSAWSSSRTSVELSGGTSISASSSAPLQIGTNYYVNGSSQYIYKANGYASYYAQTSGQHLWYTAPTGIAGNAFTTTLGMFLDRNGNLSIGATTNPDDIRLNLRSDSTQARISSTSQPRYESNWSMSATGIATINAYDSTGSAFRPIDFRALDHGFFVGNGITGMTISSTGVVDVAQGTGKFYIGGQPAEFESAENSLSTSVYYRINATHSIGRRPHVLQAVLRCKIAEHGYAVGDEVLLASNSTQAVATYSTATVAGVGISQPSGELYIASRSFNTFSPITNANWRIVLKGVWL